MKICRYITIIILLFLISLSGYAQLSKKHFIPPITESGNNSSDPRDHYIYISTPTTTASNFTIKPIGLGANNYITGSVSNAAPYRHTIGTGRDTQLFINATETSSIKTNKGYIIEADTPIYVSVRINAGSQAGALVSKGEAALGTSFRVGSYTNIGTTSENNYSNFASVMATENNTQVSFSDIRPGVIINNHFGAIPINITLNEGESYIIATNSENGFLNEDGLIGTLITSNNNIVVNCGSANGSFGDASGNGRDYGIDQIVGLSKVGTEYIFVRGAGNDDWENILIVPHTPGTTIKINGGVPFNIIGKYHVVEGDQYSANGNMYIETSEPVFAYQGVGGLNNNGSPREANQGLFFVPPLSCQTKGGLDNIANIDFIGFEPYDSGVTIITKAGAAITITGSNGTTIPPGVAAPVTGNPNYVTYKITGLTGNVSVKGNDELYVAYFNQSGAATSGSFYAGFPTPPIISFNSPQLNNLNKCIPNAVLDASNFQSFDSIKWYFNDGNGTFVDLNNSNPQLTPTQPGIYKLVGFIACNSEILESEEIRISMCPDDRDSDGIIDNIDIDNDNDGILNCTESKGDAALDLSNTRPPIIRFQDGSTNPSLATNSITGSGSINLTATGNITNTIPSSSTNENSYNLVFNEPVNVKFSEDTSITHTPVDGAFFIAKILPSNKNITLVDPDNRLLVDSDFDGNFEAGVAQISGSEIHFKINPSPFGNTPYNFYANQVNGFSLIHKTFNTTSTSTLQGNLSLTCFKLDTDSDGIKDEFDLDTDNDGIPDFIENQGTLTPLSGIDADLNGLDDIYNINLTPIDTDNDSVLDIHDLDSDNDGIYDLIETGQLGTLSDANLDGIVDGIVGVNGWIDQAETTPDSNLIGYTLNNADLDSSFSYIDLDSDGDICPDVIEAGFSDGNSDTFLGDNTFITNNLGLVTNASNGYTIPNSDYLNSTPITITTQPTNTASCEFSNTTMSLISATYDTIQWEVSTNGVIWSPITDNAIYSGSQTTDLNINNIPTSYNGYQYRAFLNKAGNSCGLYSDTITLTVNPLPILNTPNDYSQCDDTSNDGIAAFNLTLDLIKQEIDPNYISKNLVFTYYADSSANTIITNPENYQNTTPFTPETIWIGVTDSNGCFNTVTITLKVTPSSATFNLYNPSPLYECDNEPNIRDGIASFNMTDIKNHISNSIFSTVNVSVHFFESLIDANLETNEIPDITKHQNTKSPNSQSIWIRVKSNLGNTCLGLKEFSNLLNVEKLPFSNPVTIIRQCDSDTTDSILSYPFDTSQLENNILNGQSLNDVTITYFNSNGDPLLYQDSTPVTSPIKPVFLTENQTITIRVTNNTTNALTGPCYDETNLEFVIDEQPVITNTNRDIVVCDDNSNDGLHIFDLSTVKNDILMGQNFNIFFNYINQEGISIINSPTLPAMLESGNQTISVKIQNSSNKTCSATTSFNLIINPAPEFSVLSPDPICSSDPNFSIELDPIEANSNEVFAYKWEWTNTEQTITKQLLPNTSPTLTVSKTGIYSVTLTKTDGTNCSNTKDFIVNLSEKATITKNDVLVIDLSKNNSVIIDPTNLGMGNYQYALEEKEEISSSITYQDSPVFSNVKPGFYTVHVKDEFCGVSTLDISVIGYPIYFTPNNDGYHDYWQIQGIGTKHQPKSIIHIFNRYGKLIKQLSAESKGWDGTFNGSKLPTDDYWFKVQLEDGRVFSAHFTLKR